MVMITFTYLLCNAFNFVVTVMEHVFRDNALMVNPDGSRYAETPPCWRDLDPRIWSGPAEGWRLASN